MVSSSKCQVSVTRYEIRVTCLRVYLCTCLLSLRIRNILRRHHEGVFIEDRAEGEEAITLDHLARACGLEQIDTLGLGPVEQQYLSILIEGPARLNVLASMLGLPARTVSQVTEPFLIRAGLIGKDDGGRRELTVQGREHLSHRGSQPV